MTAMISVPLPNEPGALAGVLVALEDAGVRVRSFHAQALGEVAIARLVVDDRLRALGVLAASGHPAQDLDALRVRVPAALGLGESCRRLAAAGINIQQAIGGTSTGFGELMVLVDDPQRARGVLGLADP